MVPPGVLQAALAAASQSLGRTTDALLPLLLSDPGALLGSGYLGSVAESWAARLGMDAEVRVYVCVQHCVYMCVCRPLVMLVHHYDVSL